MESQRVYRKTKRTAAEIASDRAIREKYLKTRPSLATIAKDKEYTEPMSQRQYLSLMKFAAAIKAARKAQSLSLANLAKRSGIDKAALSRFESGLIENPTVSTLARIASALGKDVQIALCDARRVKRPTKSR